MIDSLREALDNNYFPYSFTNTDFLKFRPYQFVDIIRRGQWEVFSLLEDYFTPEEWEEWKTLDKVEQVIRNAVKTKDWRFVEALLKRPFTFYGMTLWSWFISEAIKQTDTTMFNKIINYMKTQKRFTQDYIDAIIQMAKEKPRS
jgi:succinate dehydrogenase flavin-adding protein (antitoxin of CptAB toxin-antitoxin module)